MKKIMEKNRRKHERNDLVLFLSVFDRKTGDHIGYLGDITSEGAMSLTEEQFSLCTELQMNVESPPDEPADDFIAVDACCVRCIQDDNFIFHNCGIHFTLINADDIGKINNIIELLKFDD